MKSLRNLLTGKGEKGQSRRPLTARQMFALAEQSGEGGVKILPGKEWAAHYPGGREQRDEKLQGLFDGRLTAQEVGSEIAPDALFYNVEDVEKKGIEHVSARIRSLSALISQYDYPRFAKFIESMRGRELSLPEIEQLYGQVAHTRIQKKMMDVYGQTGRRQLQTALRDEAVNLAGGMQNAPRLQRVLHALKSGWLCDELGLLATQERDAIISGLSGEERQLLSEWQDSYSKYVSNGDSSAYQELVKGIQGSSGLIKEQPRDPNQSSQSMEELEKELEKYKEQVVPPGMPEDQAIPPDDSDEYHTPPPSQEGAGGKQEQVRPMFEITPPLAGYYASGRKSYFDLKTKTWSKKKQTTEYSTKVDGSERSTISAQLGPGLKSLPIPNGYEVDASSLKFSGSGLKLLRDQNGCFYLDSAGAGNFSVDFVKVTKAFGGLPIAEDNENLYRGTLSAKTEDLVSKLAGSPLQKAEQARQYLLANHFYPGGGDLTSAQALQYKLRSESTGDNYIQALDQSEYLECYSANTLYISMLRRAGVPARLIVGHHVEGAVKGKSQINEKTGHAWSEIWDGTSWRRFDATPNAKPEDKKKEEEKGEKNEGAPEAKDDGVENPTPTPKDKGEKGEQGEKGEAGEAGEASESQSSGDPTSDLGEASDTEMQESEQKVGEIKEKMEKQEKAKQEMAQKIEEAKTFEEVDKIQKEIEGNEDLEDVLEDLEERLEAKEEMIKNELKDELDKMADDGFMDETRRKELEEMINQLTPEQLAKLQQELEKESRLFEEYDRIREEVMPMVEQWFVYFAERLPHKEEVSTDEDSLTRQGAFNRRSVMKARNLLFGTVKNPRQFARSFEPKFMASLLVDVSGSMQGQKLHDARKLLIFYSELFSRISEAFGYIKFSVNIFSDSVTEIKRFDQEYESPIRYDFPDGKSSTVKVRLMERLQTQGGTNMLDGIQRAADDLNEEAINSPDYASAFYFIGDGGDTCGNTENIKKFLATNDSVHGFGEHMYSAILLGNESQRSELAAVFGDEHTNVAPEFESLVEQSMNRFEDDIENYFFGRTI